jgi:hypothetical protein
MEKVLLENDSDEDVLGSRQELQVHVVYAADHVEVLHPLQVLGAQVLEDLFYCLRLYLALQQTITLLFNHANIIKPAIVTQ